MSDLSIEYSLNTPVFETSAKNILNQKIFNLSKNGNMNGGNANSSNYNKITFLIGIILIFIGFGFMWFKNDWIETEGNIISQSCFNSNNSSNSSKCKINIKYTIGSTLYSKILDIEKKSILDIEKKSILENSKIKIYYQKSNPELVYLSKPQFSSIGVGLCVIGTIIAFYEIYPTLK